MILPEIREIQVFLTLTRTGSFSAAAKELGITQPGVSAHISKLEQLMAFPLFHRLPEGTSMTEQGRRILPYIERLYSEYLNLLRRAEYWKRSQTHEVKIWVDGSHHAQSLKLSQTAATADHLYGEHWRDLGSTTDWMSALKNFETDIVISGSFLNAGDSPGIRETLVSSQPGLTVAWNPGYYAFRPETTSFPDILSASLILPTESMALGFRGFLTRWCETTYNQHLSQIMEFNTEDEALEACRLGLGVLVFPGDFHGGATLASMGLATHTAFGFLLPEAFNFSVRRRTNEQNPVILTAVSNLVEKLTAVKSI